MERRGEGFERERHVPEPGREIRPEGVEREPYREPVAHERVTEPVMRPEVYGEWEPGISLRPQDLTRWGPIFAGTFVALSLIVMLGVLGVAIGFGFVTSPAGVTAGGTAAAIWGAIVLIVAFFCGGWLASRTAAITGPMVGTLHGVAVWALTTTALLFLGAFGLAGVLGAITGPGAPMVPTPGTPGANLGLAQGAAWGTFIALILGLAAAAIGGWVGGQTLGRYPVRPAR